MPVTPDPVAILTYKVEELEKRVDKLETSTPPQQASEEEAFLEKWKAVTPEEFKAKYGIEHGKPIPAMPKFDETEAIYRARAFYSTQGFPGRRITRPNVVYDAITIIAHATFETASSYYECGDGKALVCIPDTLAYGWYTGVFDTQLEYQQSLGAGTQPLVWAGKTIENVTEPNFTGGAPSGG